MRSFQILLSKWKIIRYLWLKPFLPTTTVSLYNAEALNNSSRRFYLNIENNIKRYYNEKYWLATLMIVIMNSIPEITMPVFNRKSFYQCFRAISKICLNIRSLPKAPGPEIYIPTLLCRVYHILKANVFTIKSGSQSIYIVESLYL